MGLLSGKTLLITGVLTNASIAFHVARVAQEQGAEVVLTAYPRLSLVQRLAKRLPRLAPVIELDVTDAGQLASLAERVGEHTGHLDGVLHSIGFAPPAALGGGFLTAPWPDVATTFHASTYSLQALARATMPLLSDSGGSIVGLDFDASAAWPEYDWMGVAKAGLESCTRYLAAYLGAQGIRVNLVAAGPLRTMAARNISQQGEGTEEFDRLWHRRAPLGWDSGNAEPVARACVALFSDWFPATTGEILHVDGGAHAVG
ncbi:enoyl-ACP reductase FabI [Streptosporangium fragile]|uniref:Enoyl-[acyl-carrier-protein] reductase [NADH] n=1 Tax=Streptosporangium fragile TaxID=46186 RepID=A0ABP6I613_9ACTN